MEALGREPADAAALTRAIYTDVDPRLLPMAERNVLAHLIDLVHRNEVSTDGRLAHDARFRRR